MFVKPRPYVIQIIANKIFDDGWKRRRAVGGIAAIINRRGRVADRRRAETVIESRAARAFRRIAACFEAPIKPAFIAFVASLVQPIPPRLSALSGRVSA